MMTFPGQKLADDDDIAGDSPGRRRITCLCILFYCVRLLCVLLTAREMRFY
jgi:hypothetical protein